VNPVIQGLEALVDPTVLLGMALGIGIGMLVGTFPGVTAAMAVALASGFTLTLAPVEGLAVLLSIYVGANFGDRVPAILINTPGTPAAISTTFDGYPMAKQGKAGLALVISGLATAVAILLSMVVFAVAAVPIASFALNFGPFEFFALVVFGLTIMISISSKSLVKGILAGLFGLFLATVGHDPITPDARFTFGLDVLADKLDFIAVIIGLFGIAELFDQMLSHSKTKLKPVSSLGRWWPNKSEYRQMGKPLALGSTIGTIVGIVPAAGGDIAGLIGWDRAKRISKHPEKFGKGSIEGVVAADAASASTLGGALTTTLALGIPGDSVLAVMLGSMIIWGLQPGPQLFVSNPDLVVSITAIMVIATLVSLALNLVRMRGLVKVLDLPAHFLWASILVFCVIGTYATTNNISTVVVMLVAGVVGVVMKRTGFPAGPVVLGLLLGPLAEANLRRAMLIDGPSGFLTNPIAAIILTLAILAFIGTLVGRIRQNRRSATVLAEAARELNTPGAETTSTMNDARTVRTPQKED